MTDNAKLAAALRSIGEGIYELADALLDQPQLPPAVAPESGVAARPAPAATPVERSPFEDEAVTWQEPEIFAGDEGSEAMCPKHRVPYTHGQYGPYCKQATDDPAWGKQKGDRLWCKITPKNAAEYLRIKAAA